MIDTRTDMIQTNPSTGLALPQKSLRTLSILAVAVVLSALLAQVPVLSEVLYPIRLFATFVHEFGHAFVATATGGSVLDLQINPDGSGLTETSGGWGLLIASGGYLSTSLAGALVLMTPLRYTRTVLGVLAVGAFAGVALFHPTLGTALAGALFSLVLGVTAWKGNRYVRAIAHQFLGLQLALNAVIDLWSLNLYAVDTHTYTDAVLAAQLTPFPAIFWSVSWSILSLLMFGLAVRVLIGHVRAGR